MKTLLAVAPHLDDAVFSAGAGLARHAGQGWRVVIATCFTASVPDPTGFALACQLDKGLGPHVDYMALRRAEDVAACAILGCEPVHLPFAEAPHRGYDNAAALFGHHRTGDGVAAPLTDALSVLVLSLEPDVVFGPAAIGHHVDHVVVRKAVERLGVAKKLWADLPYAARFAFDRAGFEAVPCGDHLRLKFAASRCYTTQIGFQFKGTDGLENALEIDGAEWFAAGYGTSQSIE